MPLMPLLLLVRPMQLFGLAELAQTVVGLSEDKANVAARVAWSGAGIDLRTDTPSPDQVRAAVASLRQSWTFRDAARRIQSDFARHRPASEAAELLERLAETRSPVVRPHS
jgi:UDP:flavonoid glycosyltransferase YjiC (YdhE family)